MRWGEVGWHLELDHDDGLFLDLLEDGAVHAHAGEAGPRRRDAAHAFGEVARGVDRGLRLLGVLDLRDHDAHLRSRRR